MSSRYSKAVIFIKDNFKFQAIEHFSNRYIERNIVIGAIRSTELNCTIFQVYTPASSDIDMLVYVLYKLLEDCCESFGGDRMIVPGDFHINNLKPSKSRKRLIEIFNSFNMHYFFTEPSRGLSCIDHIFSNFTKNTCQQITYEPYLADHPAQIN